MKPAPPHATARPHRRVTRSDFQGGPAERTRCAGPYRLHVTVTIRLLLLREAHLGEPGPHRPLSKEGEEPLHGGATPAVPWDDEVVPLREEGEEAQAVFARHRLDGDPPVRAPLLHGDGDGVVRLRLVGVAAGPGAREEAVDDDARAAPGVAVDHEARGIAGRRRGGALGRLPLEARVAAPEDDPLQAAVPRRE